MRACYGREREFDLEKSTGMEMNMSSNRNGNGNWYTEVGGTGNKNPIPAHL